MKKINVLVVETNVTTSNQIKAALEKNNEYKVFVVKHSFDDLVNVLENNSIAIAIIEINFVIDFNSLNVSKCIEEVVGIPYIFISDNAEESVMSKVIDSGSSGILIKPFKIADLKANIQIAIYNHSILKTINDTGFKEYLNDFDNILPVMRVVLVHIEYHILEKIEIDDLVKITGWSRFHFTKAFTKSIGLPPKKYITMRKIENSKKLLKNNSLSINHISNLLSFKSQSDFSRIFKKIIGQSPEKYRREL